MPFKNDQNGTLDLFEALLCEWILFRGFLALKDCVTLGYHEIGRLRRPMLFL